jgi:formylmethanofuran dehydrogenase subunit E
MGSAPVRGSTQYRKQPPEEAPDMTTYYDYDDDLRQAEFRCDRCGQRTPDAKGVHLFAESICAECADGDDD